MEWLLGFLIILVVIISMIAGSGWALYITEQRLSMRKLSPPFDRKENHTTIISNPKDNKKCSDNSRHKR